MGFSLGCRSRRRKRRGCRRRRRLLKRLGLRRRLGLWECIGRIHKSTSSSQGKTLSQRQGQAWARLQTTQAVRLGGRFDERASSGAEGRSVHVWTSDTSQTRLVPEPRPVVKGPHGIRRIDAPSRDNRTPNGASKCQPGARLPSSAPTSSAPRRRDDRA